MRKILSLALALCMVFSLSTVAFADGGHSTKVRYVGVSTNEWKLEVPIQLAPGESGDVKLSGTWDSVTTVNVSADETVTLSNDIDDSTKTLGISFDGISQVGNMDDEISVTKPISVASMSGGLFGIWDGVFNYNVTVEDVVLDVVLKHNGIIPEGGTYYVNATSNSTNTGEYSYVGDYNLATAVYTEGDPFPSEVNDGDVYVYGDYEYRYNYLNVEFWLDMPEQNGWGVRVLDTKKSKYGVIIQEINNKPITSLGSTFSGCDSITKSPAIPSTVVDMMETFGNSSLKTAPTIPTNVTNMLYTFINCDNLTGEVEINATNLTNYKGCFDDTELPIVITGSNSKLVDIASKYDNVTVK